MIALGSLVEGWELEVVAGVAFALAAGFKFAVTKQAKHGRSGSGSNQYADRSVVEDAAQGGRQANSPRWH